MRWRVLGVAIIASAILGCAAQPGPSSTSQPSTVSSATPSTPEPQGSPTAAPTLSPPTGPAPEVVVASTGAPARDGTTGLDWARQHVDDGRFATALTHGPGGWLNLLSADGEIPVTPDVEFSPDLRAWEMVTPVGDAVQCGDGGSIAATTTNWLLRCGGLFRSTDGRSWQAVPGIAESVIAEVRNLASDGRTFVAWRGNYPAETAIWASTDGSDWARVNLPDAPFVKIDAVIAKPSGGFLVAGRTAASPEALREAHDMRWYSLPGQQALWTSDDGLTWRALPVAAAFEGGRITGLAADGPGGGVVAVGYRGENREDNVRQQTAVWRSTDLATWLRLTGAAVQVLEPEVGRTRVVATVDRWLLLGARLRENADSEWDLTPVGITAGSEDGASWWTIAPVLDTASEFTEIVAAGRLLVAIGVVPSGGLSDHTAVWVSPPLD